MSYIELIHKHYSQFTKSEKKVADFIVSSGEKVLNQTLQDIKKTTMVGDATIVRFCQKLGYSGFSDLKIDIAKEGFSTVKTTSTSFIQTVENHLMDAIRDTAKIADETQLNEASQLIQAACNIYIFGIGASGLTALDTESRFLRGGLQARAVTDPHFQAMHASMASEGDLIIAISLTGKTKDIYDALMIAKKNNAKIIVISNYILSPIAQLGDVLIQTAIEEHLLNGGSLTGKVSQIFAIDLLITYYEAHFSTDELAMREKIARSIVNKQIN